jgi:hypothetical protein
MISTSTTVPLEKFSWGTEQETVEWFLAGSLAAWNEAVEVLTPPANEQVKLSANWSPSAAQVADPFHRTCSVSCGATHASTGQAAAPREQYNISVLLRTSDLGIVSLRYKRFVLTARLSSEPMCEPQRPV